MFSSLVTYIFGTSTNNEDPTKQDLETQNKQQINNEQLTDVESELDVKNTIQVTSISSSVSGAPGTNKPITGKRSKNNKRQKKQQKRVEKGKENVEEKTSEESVEDFDEADWLFVEKNVEEIESLPRTDSEEEVELCVAELKCDKSSTKPNLLEENVDEEDKKSIVRAANALTAEYQRRRDILYKPDSFYNGPRHHQQRNFIQRVKNHSERCLLPKHLNIPKAASVERDMSITKNIILQEDAETSLMTQSLFSGDNYGANASFDESWFVTPPPCFTSIGPVNMVSSPFENLLIEHPSMSVYYSIRSAQTPIENHLNVNEEESTGPHEQRILEVRNSNVPRTETNNPRLRTLTAEIKQELLARNTQKCRERKERKNLCRGAMKRANKVQTNNCKNPRRSDLQHCKVLSGANNNRKICY